jgi:hypothetical protein
MPDAGRGNADPSGFRNIVNGFFTMGSKAKAARAGERLTARLPVGVPSEAQLRYLRRGLGQPGGKLPLFDEVGHEIPHRTIEICIAHGWAEPLVKHAAQAGWMMCRLTPTGYQALREEPPAGRGAAPH